MSFPKIVAESSHKEKFIVTFNEIYEYANERDRDETLEQIAQFVSNVYARFFTLSKTEKEGTLSKENVTFFNQHRLPVIFQDQIERFKSILKEGIIDQLKEWGDIHLSMDYRAMNVLASIFENSALPDYADCYLPVNSRTLISLQGQNQIKLYMYFRIN